MPTINRIVFKNIGHDKAIFTDLTINCRTSTLPGASTYVLAANGVGKTSLIGLIFKVLRPFSYEFPRGEGNKRRSFSEYIRKGTGHVMIEWVLDDKDSRGNTRYLLTGMVVEAKDHLLFYRSCYSSGEAPTSLGIENFPVLNERGEYLTVAEVKKELKGFSSDSVYFTDGMRYWEDELNRWRITPDLFRLQAMMNQRESSQDTMLNFGSELAFIQKLVGYITPLDDKENQEESLKEVKDYLGEVKDMPKILAERDYLEDIRSFLRKGVVFQVERQRAHVCLISELEGLNTGLSRLGRLDDEAKRAFDESDEEFKEKCKLKDETDDKLKETSAQLMRARLSKEKAVVRDKRETSQRIDQEKQNLDKEMRILAAVPLYREYEQFKKRADDLDDRLKERGKPLKEAYELAAIHYGIKILSEIDDLSVIQGKKKEEREEAQMEVKRLSAEAGKTATQISRARSDLSLVTSDIEKIDSERLGLVKSGTIHEGEDPQFASGRLRDENEESDRILTKLDSDHASALRRQGEIKSDIARVDACISATKKDQLGIEKKLDEAKSAWRRVVETRYASQDLRPELRDQVEPDYEEINDALVCRVKQQAVELTLERGKHDVDITNLEYQSRYYTERGFFPPGKDVQEVLKILDDHGITAKHGWQHLLDSYPNDKSRIIEWVVMAPHVLEGVFVQATDLESVKRIVIDSGFSADIPIFISLSQALEEHPSRKTDTTMVIHELLAWRHDLQEKIARAQGLAGEKRKLEELVKEGADKISVLSEFEQIASGFLSRHSRVEYRELILQRQKKEDEIATLEVQTNGLQKDIKKITGDIEKIGLDIAKEKRRKKGLEASISTIERFLTSWEKRDGLIQKKEELVTFLETLDREKGQIKDRIDELTARNKKIEDALEKLATRIQELRSDLDPIKCDDAIMDACSAGKEHPEYESIMKKSLDLLKVGYTAAKKDLETDPETKHIERELQETQNAMEKKRKAIYTPFKGIERDETKLIEAVGEYSIKHAAFDDEQIGSLLQKKKEKHDQLTRSSGEIDAEIKSGEGTIVTLEGKMKEEGISTDELPGSFDELEALITERESEEGHLKRKIDDLVESLKNLTEKIDTLKKIKQDAWKEHEQQILLFRSLSSVVQCTLSDPLPSRSTVPSFEDIEKEWTSLREYMERASNASSGARTAFDSATARATEYLDELHKRAIPKNNLLDQSHYPDIFRRFSLVELESIESTYINGFSTTIEQLSDHIKDHERKRKNIVNVFSTKVLTILGNISDLQKTRVPIPVGEETYRMNILEIISDMQLDGEKDVQEIDRRIEERFKDFEIHGLPGKITNYKELLEDLVGVSYGDRVKQVKFLIPRPGAIKPEHRDLVETLKSSGGEIATVAILLYILIAHYRMRVEGGERDTTSPFIMDNPFGKANRYDLVKAQVDLARSLGIQLIVFSGHADASVLAEFDTMQPLRAFPYDGKGFTEIDEETMKEYKMARIEGGSITFLGEGE
nr:hypothetical protein [Candidatus Sigynarchaeota archaeon]